MASPLRRLPGRYIGPHPYQVSGSLDGLTPGRREVGTGILARSREDLEAALRILGLTD